MNDLQTLGNEYYSLLNNQHFTEADLDYNIFENHKPFLDRLAQVNNCGITVFDMYRKNHIYTSYNFSEIFGYDMQAVSEQGNDYFNSRVHPDDFVELMRQGINMLKFFYSLPLAERLNYKLVNEYRILGKEDKYLYVIEQQQALELDKNGNIWFALSITDISPDQTKINGVKSQIFNYKTGQVVPVTASENNLPNLTKREKEVLQFVKDGLLSKEISDKLFISVNTVNTHRQRILEKLGANNSMEAISYATKLGLIK